MAIEKVREYLKRWNAQERIREFDVSSATVELAAQALHCEGKRIAKTLSFYQGDDCVLIVAAGDAKVDNASCASSGAASFRSVVRKLCTAYSFCPL